jgi:hypothetical protein
MRSLHAVRTMFPPAGRWLLCVFFAGAAAYFALTTFCAIVNFGWRQPMFDQWHEYETFLNLPAPQNAIQEANGHRPIFPNLIRIAEIQWFAGNQILQLSVGGLCAFLSAFLVAVAALRDRSMPLVARWASVMLAVLGVLWLANARRLLHGSEALHGYLPMLAAILASYCTLLSHRRQSLAWLGAASLCCMLATFSFGLGLASFCSVLLLSVVLRLPWRWLLLPLAALALCLLLYIFILPGNQGVRGQLSLQLIENVRLTAQWLSAPWMNGWLNLADPNATSVVDMNTRLGRFLDAATKSVVIPLRAVGIDVGVLSTLLGMSGIVAFGIVVTRTYLAKREVTQLAGLAIGAATFGLASAAITVISRREYLGIHPEQIYSDRYMAWPSLFWSSLAILLVVAATRLHRKLLPVLGVAFLVALPIVLSATQRLDAIWGSMVYRIAQQTAAQLRSGVYDEANFPGIGADRETDLREIELLRKNRIAMFKDRAWERVGSQWTGTLEHLDSISVQAHWSTPIVDPTGGKPGGHVEGWITQGIATLRRSNGQLAILDEHGTIAGLAEFSFIGPNAQVLLLRFPTKRGFDGYVRDYDPTRKYILAVVNMKTARGLTLGEIEPTSN